MMSMSMQGYGAGGFVMMILMAALIVVPFWRILPRHGIPAWVAIFAAFPLIALILLWIVAFRAPTDSTGRTL